MKVTQCFVVAVVLAILLAYGRAESGSPTSFEAAMAAAQANTATPQGAAFDAELGKQFGQRHAATMVQCTSGATETDLVAFDLVMELDASGTVAQSLVRPQTAVSGCLQKAIARDVYQKPPHAGYWVRAEMHYKP